MNLHDDSRVLHDPNATDRVSVDPWKLPDTLLNKISHFYISFIYCIKTVFIRVWVYGKTYCSINFIIQRGLYDPNATERGLQISLDVASLPLLTKIACVYISLSLGL